MKSRTDAVYDALKEKGYPDDFCREIAYKHMNTDYTATRMLGYLYRISNPRPEDVVDEMLANLSDRNAIIQKKRTLMIASEFLFHVQSYISVRLSEYHLTSHFYFFMYR